MVQKAIRIGRRKPKKKKTVVLKPPPRLWATKIGIPNSSAPRSKFEKDSLPGPSAGRGGLWMAGNFNTRQLQ